LDALKKSENERQRQRGPTLVDVPIGKPRAAQPWWTIGIAALLLVNLGVLAFVFLRHKDGASTAAAQPALVVAPPAAPTVPNQVHTRVTTPLPRADVRPLADEANPPAEVEYETVPATAAESTPEGSPLVRPLNGGVTAQSRAPQVIETVPTINDVGGTSAAGLAELHLDVHVYAQQPSARFVFINTHKYVEGQTLTEGPMVDQITPDGVILSYHSRRFLLPRQ
jgi:general secretion pathway protein B